MPHGESTANVGVLVEVESYVYLILKVMGKVNLILKFTSSSSLSSSHPQSDVRDDNHERGENYGRGGQHPRKSKFNELTSSDKVSVMCLLQQVILATCLLQQVKILPLIT